MLRVEWIEDQYGRHDIVRSLEQFKTLVKTKATDDLRNKFLTALFPKSKEQEKTDEKQRWWKAIGEILDDTVVTPAQTRDSMWGL